MNNGACFSFCTRLLGSGAFVGAGAITGGIARALAEHGHAVPEDLRRFVGPPVGFSLRTFTDVPEEDIPAVVATYRARYRTEGLAQTRIYPGVEELLERLHTIRSDVGRLGDCAGQVCLTRLFLEIGNLNTSTMEA